MRVRRAELRDRAEWLRMRLALWPHAVAEHADAIDAFLAGRSSDLDEVLLCEHERGAVIGFAELRIRNYAEGSDGTAVPHLEGWYVDPEHRGRGVGASLMVHSEEWAKRLGFSELASDAEIDNSASIAAHRALGFEETDRIVCFLKKL
jgi:aminoglycoside 6'-N-acetyltransferase I